jgi:hypothetical protein
MKERRQKSEDGMKDYFFCRGRSIRKVLFHSHSTGRFKTKPSGFIISSENMLFLRFASPILKYAVAVFFRRSEFLAGGKAIIIRFCYVSDGNGIFDCVNCVDYAEGGFQDEPEERTEELHSTGKGIDSAPTPG